MKTAVDDAVFRARSPASADAQSFVLGLVARWPADRPFDALAVLADNPHLWRSPSAVLELAAEEYRWLTLSGREVDRPEFAARFGPLAELVRDELDVQDRIEKDPAMLRSLTGDYWPGPGESAAGYKLLEELGRGTFARVFLAREPALGHRRVVVKFCMEGRGEARTLGPLAHRHVVPVHSTQYEDRLGLHVLCMPYLSRATLLDVIERGSATADRIPVRAQAMLDIVADVNGEDQFTAEPCRSARWWARASFIDGAVELATQVADALSFVHGAGVCHGDIKPSNVLITHDGRALLLDFNLAVLADLDAVRGGTLAYMAPEQLRALLDQRSGISSPDNVRADIFALGATLYHVVTGRFPFGAPPDDLSRDDALLDMLRRQREGLPDVQSLNPAVDARLAGLIHRCLELDPQHRPQSAGELRALLRAQLHVGRRCRRWAAGHPAAVLGSAAAVVLTAAVAFGLAADDQGPGAGSPGGFDNVLAAATSRGDGGGGVLPTGRGRPAAGLNVEAVELEHGCRAVSEGRYAEAIAHLDRVLDVSPGHLEGRFVRGQARLLLGEEYRCQADLQRYQGDNNRARGSLELSDELLLHSCEDFGWLLKSRDDSIIKACLGYCQVLRWGPDQSLSSVQLFRDAISLKFPPDSVWNNIGFVQSRAGDLPTARASLERALEFNPELATAQFNLAVVRFRQAGCAPRSDAADSLECAEHLHAAMHHVQEAIGLEARSPDVWLTAANIYLLARDMSTSSFESRAARDSLMDRAIEALQRAFNSGCAPSAIHAIVQTHPALASDVRIGDLLGRDPPRAPPRPATRLISPLSGQVLPLRLSAAPGE